jgi:two-component system, sensor histidine kinase PdtaS
MLGTRVPATPPVSELSFSNRTSIRGGSVASLRRAAVLVAAAALVGLIAYEWSEYRQARAAAIHELQQLARMSELQTAHMFEALNLAMTAAEDVAASIDWDTPRAAPQATSSLMNLRESVPFVRNLTLLGNDGKIRATTAENAAVDLSFADEAGFRAAQAGGPTDPPVIGDIELTPNRKEAVIPFYRRFFAPTPEGGGVVRASIAPSYLAGQYSGLPPGFNASFLLLKADGTILAASAEETTSPLIGTKVDGGVLAQLQGGSEATIESASNGENVVAVYRRVGDTPLIVAAAINQHTIVQRWLDVFRGHAIFIALAAIVSMLLYLVLRRRLLREDQLAAELAQRVEIQTQALREALDARELLLRELHHRVKNNLQIVTSLLGMQASRAAPETARRFQECQRRLSAIAHMHEQMYTTGSVGALSAKRFLLDFAPELARAYGATERIDLRLDLDEVSLNVEQATPFVLLAGEILTNAFKHGFAEEGRGSITVELRREAVEAVLRVADSGGGMPPEAGGQAQGLGMMLIEGFTRQLGGSSTIDSDSSGTRWTVRFPLAVK